MGVSDVWEDGVAVTEKWERVEDKSSEDLDLEKWLGILWVPRFPPRDTNSSSSWFRLALLSSCWTGSEEWLFWLFELLARRSPACSKSAKSIKMASRCPSVVTVAVVCLGFVAQLIGGGGEVGSLMGTFGEDMPVKKVKWVRHLRKEELALSRFEQGLFWKWFKLNWSWENPGIWNIANIPKYLNY